jgi:glutamate dehydrogenase/leucine dehydrogenase
VGVFDRMAEHGHEQVVFCFDRQTGMRAIIAIHDTALGPARGGTRYKAYASEEDALEDALRLSRGMTYKFAFTDMPRGGGKAVLLKQDGAADKRVLLRSFGRFVQLLAGRFGTGPDLGTSAQEMVDVARETDYVWAIDQRFGGTGDSTPLTASGVLAGIGAALDEVYGTPDVAGRRVAVQGLGGVGGHLAELLVTAGAVVVGADLDPGPRSWPTGSTSPSRTRTPCTSSTATCSAPTPSVACSTSTPSRGCAAGSSPAEPTTSSPPRPTAGGCWTGGSCTHPTT